MTNPTGVAEAVWEALDDGLAIWSVKPEVFAMTYEPVGGLYHKHSTVQAVRLRFPCTLQTLEGNASAAAGDWLARNASGEVWPVQDRNFDARYEPIEASHE